MDAIIKKLNSVRDCAMKTVLFLKANNLFDAFAEGLELHEEEGLEHILNYIEYEEKRLYLYGEGDSEKELDWGDMD